MQAEIDFSVHRIEDNPESQKTLDESIRYLKGKCRILFEAFMRGEILNNNNSPVGDFRRRRQDLTDLSCDGGNGFKISFHSKNGPLKNWYMTESDKQYNRSILSEKK